MKLKYTWNGTDEDEASGVPEMARAQKLGLERETWVGRCPFLQDLPGAKVLIPFNEGAEIRWALFK